MAEQERNPNNLNYLSPLGYKFQIKKIPNTNYFVQRANVPGLSSSPVPVSNPFTKVPRAGDHIEFEPFNITLKVNEDFSSYLDIFAWINGYGFPDSHKQYEALSKKQVGEAVYSDGTLIILNSQMNPSIEVTYENMFPTSISSLEFDSMLEDVEYLTFTVTFHYTKFTIKLI